LEIFKISAATNTGIKELIQHVSQVLKTLPKENLVEINNEEKLYTLEEEKPFTIEKEKDTYIVNGPAVEKLMKRVNLDDNESMYYFHKILDELGVSSKLKEMGIKDGDSVNIAGWELEWED
jgi:GTP-binding protein